MKYPLQPFSALPGSYQSLAKGMVILPINRSGDLSLTGSMNRLTDQPAMTLIG